MSYACSVFGKGFSQKFNMKRRMNNVYGLSKPRSTGVLVAHTVLQHFFTCIMTGFVIPVCKGAAKHAKDVPQGEKTMCVGKLLERNTGNHTGSPQRIILRYI